MTVHFGYFFSSIKLHQRNGRGLGNMAISGCRDLSGNGMTHLLAPKHPRRRRGDDEATGTRTRARGEKRESRVDAGVDGAGCVAA